MTFIDSNMMAEIECEKIIASLGRKGLGIKRQGRFMDIVPARLANVGYEELLDMRLKKEFLPGMELEMMERFKKTQKWYEEVVGEIIGERISHKAMLNEYRLWMWLEPTHEDRRDYKYAIMNARKWHKTITTAAQMEAAHRFAWRSEFWEILKQDCTLRELEIIENDIHETLEVLKGQWSALKFTPKNDRKAARYEALRKQFGQCYSAMQMIEDERFDRDKQRMQDSREDLISWHPLDEDPIQHERDAYRMRLHHWADAMEKAALRQ